MDFGLGTFEPRRRDLFSAMDFRRRLACGAVNRLSDTFSAEGIAISPPVTVVSIAFTVIVRLLD